MNIGTAIKELRKKKGFSQKQLAKKCDLSVNALCQIEINNAFPQKGTISRICDVLEIPTSYLLLYSIDENDVPEDKRSVFNTLSGTIKDLLVSKS